MPKYIDDAGGGGRDAGSPAAGGSGLRRNRLEIIFVVCWLGAWTLGILWNVADWLKGIDEEDAGAAALWRTWLLPASAAWIAVAAYLVWLLRGGKSLTGWWTSDQAATRFNARDGARSSGVVQRNWFMIIFVSVWLAGWTLGIIAALSFLILVIAMGELGLALFLVFWLIGAIVGWFVILRIIKHLYRGGSAWTWNPWSGQ